MYNNWDYSNGNNRYNYRPTGFFFPGLFFLFLLVMMFSWGWLPGLFALFLVWRFANSGACSVNKDDLGGEKRKNHPYITDIDNGEKPKRDGRYIHTPDGETLEIV